MPADIFIGNTSNPATRFASLNEMIYFGEFFSCANFVVQLSADGGTAPDLWHYTYGARGYSLRSSTGPVSPLPPFAAHSNLTNWPDIPAGWK